MCFCRDAFLYVQQRRFCINPNEGFAQQLTVSYSYDSLFRMLLLGFMTEKLGII